jgi:hypothetical protein
MTPGNAARADGRIRTADSFITKTLRRVAVAVAVGGDGLGHANFSRFASERVARSVYDDV